MEVTALGMVINVRPLQPQNARSPMEVTALGMVINVRPLQPRNASFPIKATVLGITVFLQPAISVLVDVSMMALQSLRLSYTAFPASTCIDVKPLQKENTWIPMVVIELGMVTDVRPLHSQKAASMMPVTAYVVPPKVTLAGMASSPMSS